MGSACASGSSPFLPAPPLENGLNVDNLSPLHETKLRFSAAITANGVANLLLSSPIPGEAERIA